MLLSAYRKTILLLTLLLAPAAVRAAPADFSMTHYTNENGLPQNTIKGLELDKDGFLWIATEAGLVRFDGQRFRLYDRDHYPVLKSNRIVAIERDDKGELFFSDEFGNNYDCSRGGTPRYLPLPVVKSRVKAPRHDFFWTKGDSVFYGPGHWELQVAGLRNDMLPGRWATSNHKFYFCDKQELLWRVDTNRNLTRARITGLLPDPRSGEIRVKGLYLHDKTLYLHAGKGIYRLSEESDKELTATLVLETELQNISFYRNYPELNLQMIGTQTNGLYLFRRRQFTTLKHSNGFGNYYPQAPIGDSGVLTDKGPVYPFSSRFDYPFRNFIRFRSLLLDSRGCYWISEGSYGNNSIVELDPQLKVRRRFPSFGTANCFRETPDGRIWMSSYIGTALGCVDRDSLRWLPLSWHDPQSIATFLPADNETFWIAGRRLFALLNIKTGKQIHYPGLEKYTIETLYFDREKVLWIGTTGNGFFALKQNKIIKLPLDKNAGLKDVHSFIEDKSGFIWMSSNNGLFRCKKADLDHFIAGHSKHVYYQCFKKESGFNTNEFNGSCTPSAIMLGNGKFSISSLEGLVQFYPDSIREVLPDTKIIIDRLLADGNAQDLERGVVLPPDFNHLEIEVASPFFGLADNQQLEYNVKGLDDNWYRVKDDNSIVLNHLSHGKYSLQLRKRAGFGNNNLVTASLPFTVSPFFYQTWAFRLAAVVLLGLVIFVLVRMRYAFLTKRNRELEAEVVLRTTHLDNANRLKEKMLMMVGHDLQSPLHFLDYLSQVNLEAVSARQHEEADKVSRKIKSTSRKLYAFVDEFSLWARVQDSDFNLRKTTFPLSELIADLQLFFRDILQFHGNTIECTMSGDYRLHTNTELLKAVLRNLIDNANKYTRNGLIRINCMEDKNDTCLITVSDNGAGIAPEDLNNINDLIRNARKAAATAAPNGRLGYQFIVDFVMRLGADITITSEKNKGTTISISGIPALRVPAGKNKVELF